ncbi:MAG: LysE family transporter [Spirochaetia bacterium]|nr:LysE family transporter [Spirochaetia bacterium]
MALWEIHLSLGRGWRTGLAAAFGAASADGLYGCLAAIGLHFFSGFLVEHARLLRLAGGIFLLSYGLRQIFIFQKDSPRVFGTGLSSAWASGFMITGANPVTILTFSAVLVQARMAGSPWPIAFGVFAGSLAWYAALGGAALFFRERLSTRLHLIRRITAFAFVGTGLVILASAIFKI